MHGRAERRGERGRGDGRNKARCGGNAGVSSQYRERGLLLINREIIYAFGWDFRLFSSRI